MNHDVVSPFSFRFGQMVRVKPPHQDAGATGCVTNSYLFKSGVEEIFVSVAEGTGVYSPRELEPAPTSSQIYAVGNNAAVQPTKDGFTMIVEALHRLHIQGDLII